MATRHTTLRRVQMQDYYTPPSVHANQIAINLLTDKLDELQAEYNALTADDVEWTAEGEARCNVLEEEIGVLYEQIANLFEGY
jgi:hypothetical protein